MEDEQIVALYWSREESAIHETALKYGNYLNSIAYNILQDQRDAEESVNDTYIRTWNSLPPQRPVYFFAYLAKICRNLSLGLLEKRSAQKRCGEIVSLTAELELCIPDRRVEDTAEGKYIGELLNRFLSEISKENRMIFLRRYWFADSIQQIAERYGVTQSNVKIRLHRTRNKLRDYLQQEGITI